MSNINVLVNGAHGKMGVACTAAISSATTLNFVGGIGPKDNLEQSISDLDAQVVVDFTRSSSAYGNTKRIIEAGCHPVIGTSGFLPDQLEELSHLCAERKLGAIIAPNFSIGAILMMQFSKQAAAYFPDVEIIEQHHEKKHDSPSGTAMKTAELIAQTRTQVIERRDLETIQGTRGGTHQQVRIHAVRLPGRLAEQEVIFGGQGEVLTIKHETADRSAFMPGVVMACEKVINLNHLVYGLENIL